MKNNTQQKTDKVKLDNGRQNKKLNHLENGKPIRRNNVEHEKSPDCVNSLVTECSHVNTQQTSSREMELMEDTASEQHRNKNGGSQVIRSAKTEKPQHK